MKSESATAAPAAGLLSRLRRRMPSLHRSTWVVAALIAAGLVFANIPGQMKIDSGEHGFKLLGSGSIDHGWPWPFLRRGLGPDPFARLGYDHRSSDYLADLSPDELWAIGSNVKEVSFSCLAGNVAVAIIVLGGSMALFEAWRRRRHRMLQFYLIELFGLVAVVCVLLSWISVAVRERDEEQEAVRRMTYISHDESVAGPHWLRRLIDPAPFTAFDRVEELSIENNAETFGGKMALEIACRKFTSPEQFSHLRYLQGLYCGRESATIVRFLPRPDRLKRLKCIASDAGLAEIQRCRNLEKLVLEDPWTGEPFSDAGMARLET